jgi:TrmH family RNA methyltransferase
MSLITSTANPLYKKIQSLDKSRERRKQGLFWVEGQKEVEMALANGFEPEVVIYSSRFDRARGPHLQQHHYVEFSSDLFERVCYRESVSDIGAIFKVKPLALNSLKLGDKPFVLILESVEKPGNLGAILRTADAAGVNAIFIILMPYVLVWVLYFLFLLHLLAQQRYKLGLKKKRYKFSLLL